MQRFVRRAFGGVQAVRDVSFSVAAGEMLALIGPNGAGKTTCFNMLNGQIAPDAAGYTCWRQDITGLKPREIWRLGVGRTFQITATFASMTVRENVQMALSRISHESVQSRCFALPRLCARRGEQLLELVGMARQADARRAVLAYGDLKRLELAIALANQPRLLLMDEPTAGMAPARARRADAAHRAARARSERSAVLFTEHDMDVVFAHADRILVLNRGSLIAEGDAGRGPRRTRGCAQVYLGEGSGTTRVIGRSASP